MEKKLSEQEKKKFLYITNKDINGIIKIITYLEDSIVLIDRVTETVKHKIKKQEHGFLPGLLVALAASLVQLAISSVVKI